jgi:hypothetical protein
MVGLSSEESGASFSGNFFFFKEEAGRHRLQSYELKGTVARVFLSCFSHRKKLLWRRHGLLLVKRDARKCTGTGTYFEKSAGVTWQKSGNVHYVKSSNSSHVFSVHEEGS